MQTIENAVAGKRYTSSSARRSPEQIFEFLDKDKNGTLSEAEFGVLKDKMPTLQARPDGVSAKFKELDKNGDGILSQDELRPPFPPGPPPDGEPEEDCPDFGGPPPPP